MSEYAIVAGRRITTDGYEGVAPLPTFYVRNAISVGNARTIARAILGRDDVLLDVAAV
jgi:hypothetical protein